jgi:hypothetical protein
MNKIVEPTVTKHYYRTITVLRSLAGAGLAKPGLNRGRSLVLEAPAVLCRWAKY